MKNLIYLVIFLFFLFTGKTYSQFPQKYTSFENKELNLYKWEGKKVMLLSKSDKLDVATMKKFVEVMDGTYNYYFLCTGKEPIFYYNRTYINNRSTLAEVPSTCGAGCGYLGWTGIELLEDYFQVSYKGILNNDEFDQVPFYEFGRNFWFYGEQLGYKDGKGDPTITGYAVFMRFMAMEHLEVKGGPFGELTFTEFKNQLRGLLNLYLSDENLTWHNTLAEGKGIPGVRWGDVDLFASFCFYLKENYGGHEWVKKIWREVEKRPKAESTQDAVDNFIIASSKAANKNLVFLFKEWRWPVSQKAIEELEKTLGLLQVAAVNNVEKFYPNPTEGMLYSDFSIEKIELFSQNGELLKVNYSEKSADITNLSKGIYYIKATTKDNKIINQKIIKK